MVTFFSFRFKGGRFMAGKNPPFSGDHFADFCESMVGQPYWYGTALYPCTRSLLAR